jgi:hypothetical protein
MDTTQRTSSRNEFAYDNANSKPNPNIGWLGTRPQNIRQRSTAATQRDCAFADYGMGFGTGGTNNQWGVLYNGKGIDIIAYQSDVIDLWVDNEFIGCFKPFTVKGATAQAGGASTITLASNSDATNGWYVGLYVAITSGTGAGQIRKVASYVGSTKIATLETAWTTQPDATSVYNITASPNGWGTEPSGGATLSFIHLDWPDEGTSRIDVVGAQRGFIVESLGILSPAPARGQLPVLVVSDSFWEGSADPRATVPKMIDIFGELLGNVQISNLSGGGTALTADYTVSGRLNFADRIAPAAEARMLLSTMTAGTFTISVTVNGQTSTTSALAYNASLATIKTALNALSAVTAAGGDLAVGGGLNSLQPFLICPHNLPGATFAFDTANATGTITDIGQYTGDIDRNLPRDADGNALPFVLLTGGSGNETGATDATVQAAAIYVAQQINARFPTAITVFMGVIGDAASGSTGVITTGNVSRNAAVQAGAQLLPKINGRVPFIDSYEAGVGGNMILFGTGTVAAPVAGTTAKYKSITNAGHPTGFGALYIAQWVAKRFLDLVQP